MKVGISENILQVRARLAAACAAAQRPVNDVALLAVSKFQPVSAVLEAHQAGQREFGENYVQEALDKIAATSELRAELVWHLIGPLQSNKTRVVTYVPTPMTTKPISTKCLPRVICAVVSHWLFGQSAKVVSAHARLTSF